MPQPDQLTLPTAVNASRHNRDHFWVDHPRWRSCPNGLTSARTSHCSWLRRALMRFAPNVRQLLSLKGLGYAGVTCSSAGLLSSGLTRRCSMVLFPLPDARLMTLEEFIIGNLKRLEISIYQLVNDDIRFISFATISVFDLSCFQTQNWLPRQFLGQGFEISSR